MAFDILDQPEFSALAAKYAPEMITVLRATDAHTLYRLAGRDHSYIIKAFHSPSHCIEPKVYELLNRYGVPTLPVYEISDRAIVMEDIQSSPAWRLADPCDMEQPATGEALAEWYLTLHRAGQKAFKDPDWARYEVSPWVMAITPGSLARAGAVFKLENMPAWQAAKERAPAWIEKYLALSQTFNYNDFAVENLALARGTEHPLQAIVFDYDCFATGVAYSDWRNVMASLQGAARIAFQTGYGQISVEEQSIDEPLAVLYGLGVASQREKIPSWASPLVESVIKSAKLWVGMT
jgi:hypothetical protein